eukprot:15433613-Alexandrium_andersonii.AAC.2
MRPHSGSVRPGPGLWRMKSGRGLGFRSWHHGVGIPPPGFGLQFVRFNPKAPPRGGYCSICSEPTPEQLKAPREAAGLRDAS